ncbi:MAG: F0F1 ATP synthase subunit A [Bacteroidales bacterium]|nr:F0F1 ATP synthase subunit A [Bacteroidales bacterium]
MKIKVFAMICAFCAWGMNLCAEEKVYTGFEPKDELPDIEQIDTTALAQEMTAEEIAALDYVAQETEEGLNPGSIIIGHVTDAHSWHLFDWQGKDGKEHGVAVSLPVILVNDGHLDIFMSKNFEHGHADYKGYRLVGGGMEKEEIICVDQNTGMPILNADGTYKKPIDISLTKTSAAIIIAVALLIWLVLAAAKQARKRGNMAPKGLQNLVEILVLHVKNDMVKPMLGDKSDKYLPYLLTLFFFIIFCNVLGLIPFFPAGANITGNIAVTGVLALITFLVTNLSGNKHYWKDIFNTPGVPAFLKVFPLMPIVELLGIFTKPIVLMIRLFANMTAGHIVVLGFITIIFIISNAFGAVAGGCVTPVAVFFAVFIDLLECLVAYLQAFVFTMLSALYIGMAVEEPESAEA